MPDPVFYGSPEWREHFRRVNSVIFALTGANADRQIEMMQRSDSSAGSAVCEDCIHMFAE